MPRTGRHKATKRDPILDPVIDRALLAAGRVYDSDQPLQPPSARRHAAATAAARAAVSEISVAMASTRHCDFVATGPNPDAAREALLKAWRFHCEQEGGDPHYLDDGINVLTGPLGQAFHDTTPYPWTPKEGK